MESNEPKREDRPCDVVPNEISAAKFTHMLHPIPSILITLPKSSYQICCSFAHHCHETNRNEYLKRNQSSPDKIRRQIITGKLGELAVYYYLTRYSSAHTSEVDFLVYGKTNKSYDPDLVNNGHHLHIKSVLTTQANQFGLAWLMQKSDPLFKKSFDQKKAHKIVMCQVLDRRNILLHGFIGVNSLVVGEPKIERLRETKCAIWFDKQPKNKIRLLL